MNCLKYYIKNERLKAELAWEERQAKMTSEEKEQERKKAEEAMMNFAIMNAMIPQVYR